MPDMITMVVGYYHCIDLAYITAMGSKPFFGLFAVYPCIEEQLNALSLNVNAVAVAA